ncbi:cell division protein FtsQ/DivIB [Asticcacaulis sp. 201]|uniref:cell division protein FtsQ/DivIB n=1 Tax=Asticcacaulis sp. 201 TaxID=3028787 RepID=UPI0029161A87|nr:cell division protein FtsQ/DivIB [Asticcacaulis sp. 201]MDV6332518.1 FtsQ-type POTRA domain-containing protein [Asticcacaulis sp. 201]
MPAVVRGGRRQAAPAAPKSAGKAAPRSPGKRSAGRKAAQAGKPSVIGAVHMPNELTGWLAVAVIVGLLSVVLATGHRAEALGHAVTDFADSRMAALGLRLQKISLVGVSPEAMPDVKRALKFEKDQPFALMNLANVQKDIEAVGWVKSATVRRQFPGVLIIDVVERPRLAVWQYQGKNTVIDDQGNIIPEAISTRFPNLPYVVGEGANEAAPDIIELMRQRPALMQKTYALQRVDTRRWNILLKNTAVIKLPALNQEQALGKLDALMAQQRVLDQGFASIDLLDPDALVVVPLEAHPKPPAA